MPGGFQSQVFNQEAQAVAGDRASLNPIATLDAGPGGLVADPSGIIVGNFAWTTTPTDPDGANTLATQVVGSGIPAGFAYNWTQALNTVFLSDASMLIPQGLPVALATQGDFWCVNSGAGSVQPGMKAYATFGTGGVSFAATASPTTTATSTVSTIATQSAASTGSIQNDILTVTAWTGPQNIYPGTVITGTGILTGTIVKSQLSGTPGQVGTYLISPSQQKSIASQSLGGTYGLFSVLGTVTGTYAVGQVLSGGTTSAGTTITYLISGTGGVGSTFAVTPSQTVAAAALNAAGNVETKWVATSAGVPGALIRMSSWG